MSQFKLIDITRLGRYNTAIQTWVKAVNDLANYYLKSETYTKTEVDALLTAIKNGSFVVVTALPDPITADCLGKIYLKKPSAQATSYEEYIVINVGTEQVPSYQWELIGDTDIKLANYYTKSETDQKIADAIAPFKTEAQIMAIIEAYGYATDTDLQAEVERATGAEEALDGRLDTAEGKLEGIEDGAQVNIIESVKVGAVAAEITNKTAFIDLATDADVDSLFDGSGSGSGE